MADDSTRWEQRPWLARGVRTTVSVAPIVMSIGAVIITGRLVPRPSSLALTVLWWIGLTGVATLVMWLTDRAVRRLLPVAALFKLSLVFPDRAPSRFKTAIRGGTVRQLQRQVEAGEFSARTPQEAAEQLIGLAATLNGHDRLTRGHTERVRAYSVMIGEEMGLDAEKLELLNWSGLMHDIGKLAVPSEILNKPGRPSDEEWMILRDHPARADALIEPLRAWLGPWAESATQHHERFDGAGYPHGLAGEDISLAGRIVAVADAYDVMTSTRSYKKAMSAADARAELARHSGTQFDPFVVRTFLNLALGRLRLVMGPLSSLVQFPAGGASLGSSVVTGAGAMTAVAAAGVVGAFAEPPPPVATEPEAIAYVAPEAVDARFDGSEDEALTVDLAGLFDEPPTSLELIGQPEEGTVALAEDGTIIFEPEPDFNGIVEISYRTCFVDGSCDDGVVTITVAGTNDPPLAAPDGYTIDEDGTAAVDVLANDEDIDGDPLTIAWVELLDDPDHPLTTISARIEANRIVVKPLPDTSGRALINYTITDPHGLAAISTLTVDVVPVDDAPVAEPDVMTAYENTEIELAVLANDHDADGDDLTIVGLANVTGGAVSTDGETVTFVPLPRHVGPAAFNYTISDGTSTATSSVDLDVIDITSTPLVAPDSAVLDEDRSATIDVLANDIALTSTLAPATMTIVRAPAHGTVAWDGALARYTPDPDFWGDDSFDYLICDVLEFCNISTVTVTVAPVNDAPVVQPTAAVTVLEDSGPRTHTGWAGTVAPGPTNESAQTLSFTVTNTNPSLFSAQPAIDPTGELTYTPAPDHNGTATITVTATDNGGTTNGGTDTTPPTTATITITPVNDNPEFTPTATVTAAEDSGPRTHTGWAGTVAPGPTNESAQTLSFTVTNTNPSLFSAQPAIDPTGELTYTPAPDHNGTATITVTATDNGGTTNGGTDTTPPTTATITITPVNDNPTAVDDTASVTEDDLVGVTFGVLGNDSDLDGDTVLYGSAVAATIVNGTLTDHADGTFTYVPDEHFTGTETFTYTTIDGNGGADTGDVTITVTAVPDAPVATNDARATLVDTPLSVPAPGVLSNDYDVDGEALTVNTTPITPPANGALTLGADGSYLYTPGGGFVGTDSFTYEISDPGGATGTATVTITVDSGVVNQTYYLGDSGSSSWDYDFTTSLPGASTPPFDSDSDGDPGLTIDAGSGSEFDGDPAKFQLWRTTAVTAIDIDGPVTLDLWATVKDYDLSKSGHPYVFLYDCLGLSCTKLAETDVHVGGWNQGVADFVNRQLDLGSVSHTVAPGRDLVLKLVFKHDDMWIGQTAAFPSALILTRANVAPIANDDSLTIDEDDPVTNVAVLANDVDADIDPSTVTVVAAASAGTATPLGNGTINYLPNADAEGIDTFDYQVCDLGGNCDTATVTVTVNPVNDEPTFIGGGNVVAVLGANTFAGWATAMDAGAPSEAGQTLGFTITGNDNPGLFAAGPAVNGNSGDLIFTAVGSGTANITIVLSDSGGTANGGDDTSTAYAFTIIVP